MVRSSPTLNIYCRLRLLRYDEDGKHIADAFVIGIAGKCQPIPSKQHLTSVFKAVLLVERLTAILVRGSQRAHETDCHKTHVARCIVQALGSIPTVVILSQVRYAQKVQPDSQLNCLTCHL